MVFIHTRYPKIQYNMFIVPETFTADGARHGGQPGFICEFNDYRFDSKKAPPSLEQQVIDELKNSQDFRLGVMIEAVSPEAEQEKIETIKVKHGSRHLACPICQKVCRDKRGFVAHMRKHKGPEDANESATDDGHGGAEDQA